MIAYLLTLGRLDDNDYETEFYLYANKETAFIKYMEACRKEKDGAIRYSHYVIDFYNDYRYPTDEEYNNTFNKCIVKMHKEWLDYNVISNFNDISDDLASAPKLKDESRYETKNGTPYGVDWGGIGLAIVEIK